MFPMMVGAPRPPWFSDPLTREGRLQWLSFYGVATQAEHNELVTLLRPRLEAWFADEIDQIELRARRMLRNEGQRREAERDLRYVDYLRQGIEPALAKQLMREHAYRW